MLQLREQPDGSVRMAVKAVPGSSRDRIVGELGAALKVAVSVPPERGQANRVIVALIAERLGIHPAQIEIIRGHTSSRKEVSIRGRNAQHIREALSE